MVTALFADIAGFTSLADQLPPDDLHELIGPLISRLAAVGESYGAFVAKYAGDALLLCFGAPVAQEDHATRSLLVALEMHRELEEAAKEFPVAARHLKLHIGVNTGVVVAGMFGGETPDYSILGDAVNVAQRLESAALGGHTYVGEATYQLTRTQFAFESTEALQVKGKGTPLLAWRLLGERADEVPFPTRPHTVVAPLVGRESEIAAAWGVLDSLLADAGGLVFITGEAGIGKSRLLLEIQDRVRGVQWLDGRCTSYGTSTAYSTYADLVRRYFDIRAQDTQEVAGSRLTARLSELGLQGATPFFAGLLGVTADAAGDEIPTLPPEIFRRGLHDALSAWVRVVAGHGPLALAIEDLHWADTSTIDFTLDLAHLARQEGFVLLLTARTEGEGTLGAIAHAAGEPDCRLSLRALDEAGIGALIEQVLGGDPPPGLVHEVFSRTTGNPFFAEEMVRSLLDSKTLRNEGGSWRLDVGWNAQAVPATIEGVLSARIDLLPRQASALLQTASIIGHRIRRPLLQNVAIDVPDFNHTLEQLIQTAFLDRMVLDDEELVVFHHALVQDVAYSRLTRSRRRELHRRVAEAGEHLYGAGDDIIEFLARQLYLGSAGLKAVEYALRAADRCKRLFANAEAITCLNNGLELVPTLPESERDARELALLLAMATPLMAARGYASSEVGDVLGRSRELCHTTNDLGQLLAPLWGLFGFATVRADFQEAGDLAQQLADLAQGSVDPLLLLASHHAAGVVALHVGKPAEADLHLQEATAFADQLGDPSLADIFGQHPSVSARSFWALALWLLGEPDRAKQVCADAVSLAHALSQPFTLAFALLFDAWLGAFQRDAALVRERAEEVVACSEGEFPLFGAMAMMLRGWALSEQGQPGEGAAELREGLTALGATGARMLRHFYLALLAEAHGRAGEFNEGLAALEEGLAEALAVGERFYEPELHRLRGEFLGALARGRSEEAEESVQKSLAIARSQQARSLEMRAEATLRHIRQHRD